MVWMILDVANTFAQCIFFIREHLNNAYSIVRTAESRIALRRFLNFKKTTSYSQITLSGPTLDLEVQVQWIA